MTNSRTPNSMADQAAALWSAAEQAVNHRIEQVEQSTDKPEVKAAVLQVWGMRESSGALQFASNVMAERIERLSAQLDAFTKATDASSRQLTRWTKVMAWATIALAVFAVAQILVTLLHRP